MSFTNAAWSTPRSDLSPEQYCAVCLIDLNPKGKPKLKENCKLPLRARPGGPYNKNAIQNAMGRIFQTKGVPGEARRKAARSLVRLAGQAGMEVGDSVRRLAGGRAKKR